MFGLGSAGTPSLAFSGDTNTGIFSPGADTIAFAEGGTEVMRINSSGNLGIGTSSPGEKLQVAGNAVLNAGGGNIFLQVTSGSSSVQLATDGTTQFIYGTGNIPLTFSTNGVERMRIKGDSKVLIGSSNSDLEATSQMMIIGSQGLAVQFGGSTGTFLKITPGNANGVVNLAADARSGAFPPLTFSTSDTERMRIDSAGRVITPAQPAFHAVSTSIKEITGSPFIFDTTYFNTGGHYNTSNGRFTAPIAGIYHLQMDFLTAMGNTNTIDLRFWKNGVQTQLGTAYYTNYTGGDHRKGFMIALASLNANDYITVQTQNSASNGNLYGDNNESGGKGHTAFRAFLMG